MAHFRRRLVGESEGDDFLGRLDRRQQREKALRQQFGLARAGRRLDDAGLGTERTPAGFVVFAQQRFVAYRHCSSFSGKRSNGSTSQ